MPANEERRPGDQAGATLNESFTIKPIDIDPELDFYAANPELDFFAILDAAPEPSPESIARHKEELTKACARNAPSTPREYEVAQAATPRGYDAVEEWSMRAALRLVPKTQMRPAPSYDPRTRTPTGRASAAPAAPTGPLQGLDLTTLFDGNDGEDWILEPLIVRGGGTQLQSEPGLGKSLLSFDIAMALANADRYVLGVKPDRKYRVVYIDFENDPRRDVVRWLRNLGYGPDPSSYENLRYITMPSMAALNTAEGGATILATVKEHQADVVIVDTLSRSIDGDENDASTFLEWYRHTGMPLKREGVAWVRIDHLGKDASKGGRGSSAKSGDPDLVWNLRHSDAATFRLVCAKHRMPLTEEHLPVQRIPEVWEGDKLVSPLEHRIEMHITEHEARVVALVEALDAAEIPEASSVRSTTEAVRDVLGLTAKNDAIREAVRRRKARAGIFDEDQE